MRNCRHFPLSLQFLFHSLSDLHNRTHLNRTVDNFEFLRIAKKYGGDKYVKSYTLR